MRTKSGQLACRACVAKHREKQRASNAARQDIPTAELVNPTETALPRNLHNQPDEQVPLAEIIDDDNNGLAGIPTGGQPEPPGPSPFDGLPSTAAASAFPTSGPQWLAAPTNVADGSRTGTGSVRAGGTAAGSVVAGGRCPQHPASAVVHHCSVCHQAVCRTCTFAFAPNLICCPECASETSTPLSLHRQAMVYSSLACAIFASLMAALLFSGLLVFMDNIPFGGLVLETLIVLPLCLGIGTAFGSYNRAEGNPAMLWVGGIWNGLGLIAWVLFLGIVTLSGLLID